MIEIDGAFGEGGGQIVRSACALSVLTRKPCHIFHIRQARREPGLRPQHMLAVNTLAELSGGSVEGGGVGSQELIFRPGNAVPGDTQVTIATAASVTLIAQCLIPALLSRHKSARIGLRGGATDTAFSPPLDYFRYVFLWFLKRLGIGVNVELTRRGYYPKGGAEVTIQIEGGELGIIGAEERGSLKEVRIISSAASILKARKVAERQAGEALRLLRPLGLPLRAAIDYSSCLSAGSALCIVAYFDQTAIGANSLGARGKFAEEVGLEAAELFGAELNSTGCLDRHMADQILPYMAMAGRGGRVTVTEVTGHCRTNMWVIEKFLEGRFEVRERLISWNTAARQDEPWQRGEVALVR
jgi:RNA 3'-terminal phosphate cyclase (GTP)